MLIADEALRLRNFRSDLGLYEVPFSKIAGQVTADSRLRKLLANMTYVGVLAHLLQLDYDAVERAVWKQFKNKAKAEELNLQAVQAGFGYAVENLVKTDPFRVERMDTTDGKILIDGNQAAAIGATFGACTVVTWYPITLRPRW